MSEQGRPSQHDLISAETTSFLSPREARRLEGQRAMERINDRRFEEGLAFMRAQPIDTQRSDAVELMRSMGHRLLRAESHLDPSASLEIGFEQKIPVDQAIPAYSLMLRYSAEPINVRGLSDPTERFHRSKGIKITADRKHGWHVYNMAANSLWSPDLEARMGQRMEGIADVNELTAAVQDILQGGWKEVQGEPTLKKAVGVAMFRSSPYFDFRKGTDRYSLRGSTEPGLHTRRISLETGELQKEATSSIIVISDDELEQ